MKLKKIIITSLFFTFGIVCFAHSVNARDINSRQTKNALEYSLTSLYERAEEIAEHNQWLEVEIKTLQDERRNLERQAKLLDREIAVLKDNTFQVGDSFEARVRELQLTRTNIALLNTQIKELTAEHNRLEREYTNKRDKKIRMQKQIAAAINRIGAKGVGNLDPKYAKIDSDIKIKRTRLSKLKAEVFEEIYSLQSKIKGIEQADSGLLAKVNPIKEENEQLKRDLKDLQDEIETLKKDRDQLSSVINSSKSDSENFAQDLEKRISQLKTRRQELRGYFAKIETTMKGANLQGNIDQREKELQNNLLVIQKENTKLNEEVGKILGSKQMGGILP